MKVMREAIEKMITDNIRSNALLFNHITNIQDFVYEIINCYKEDNKVMICGNGGSAADSQHIAGELVCAFKIKGRKPLEAIALTTDTSVLTAWSNDYSDGFDTVFARQVEAHGKKGDVLLGLSTSGNSKNVINAFQKGREIGTKNLSLTGKGGRLKEYSDLNLSVNSEDTPRIQEAHMLVYHIICELVEKEIFGGISSQSS